ncbi:MAG: hypothetical protein SFY66_28035 [Oculatellaceae cyanobacterium bins.114]|nr:hypothetical protein [Oculatellaceae cyanobacterium bins.114]
MTMIKRGLVLAIALLSCASSAAAQVLTPPTGTTGLTPIEGSVTNVEPVRVPLGDAVTGSETRVTLQFQLQGCLDSLMPLITHYEVRGRRVNVYVTALNAHNEQSMVARCVAMPQVSEQVRIPGLFQRNQIRVVFMGQLPETRPE